MRVGLAARLDELALREARLRHAQVLRDRAAEEDRLLKTEKLFFDLPVLNSELSFFERFSLVSGAPAARRRRSSAATRC